MKEDVYIIDFNHDHDHDRDLGHDRDHGTVKHGTERKIQGHMPRTKLLLYSI